MIIEENEDNENLMIKVPKNMVYVKGDKYLMGTRNGTQDELPVHEVIISDLFIEKYEVTFADYDNYCHETGKQAPQDRGWGRDTHPVIYVSWYDTIIYRNWLSKKKQLDAVLYDKRGNSHV